MTTAPEHTGSGELSHCREMLKRLRVTAVETAAEAMARIMAQNIAVLSRIDAAINALDPTPGEPPVAHRARVAEAIGVLDCDQMLLGEKRE